VLDDGDIASIARADAGDDAATGNGVTAGAGLEEVHEGVGLSGLWTLLAWTGGVVGSFWLLYGLFGPHGGDEAWKSGS
jgi:hypothetical protein